MRTLLLFLITCVIGTGALLAANTMKHPLPLYIVGFGIWILFICRVTGKRG